MVDESFLDWPFFEDRHRDLARAIDEWAERKLADVHELEEAEGVDGACGVILDRLATDGWLDYVTPAAYGGAFERLDVRSLCLIRENLGRRHGLADFVFAMQGLGSGAISQFGSDEIKAVYLPAVRSGAKVAAFALTEPESGSDVANMTTEARREGDEFVINGAKTYISNGGIASFYTLFARTGEAPGAKGVSAIVVDANSPGLEVAERIDVMAPHPLATLRFTDVRVPIENLLGTAGGGFKCAMATLDIFRPTVGAAALGFARRALDEALGRAKSRRLFGGTLADLPVAQSQLADMALDVDASALLIYRAAWAKDRGQARITREAAMAKLYATEAAQRVIDAAVQLHGGDGVRRGFAVEALYREIRALRIYEGASEVQKLVIARAALGA